MPQYDQKSFSKHSLFYLISVIFLLVGGFLVRMIDLTDQPLDFHATRQLRAAVIARSIYLQMDPSADLEHVNFATDPALIDYVERREPPITEAIVALTYLLIGREVLWVSRIITSLFWCIGGLGIYYLVRRMISRDAALISLGFFMFLPFGIIASRSFQPEALMVAGMVWSLALFLDWLDDHTWKNAIFAGTVIGFTLLVKPNPLFMLLPVFLLLLIFREGLRKAIKDRQVWLIAGLAMIFALTYYLFINPGAGGFFTDFWQNIITVIPTSRFFLGWGSIVTDIVPFTVLVMALAGVLLYHTTGQLMTFGLWVGYVALGFFFPHHISTHNYYSIVLIPIVAICLGSIGKIVAEKASEEKLLLKIGLILVAIFALIYASWNVYKDLTEKSYRGEPGGWKLVGDALPEDQEVIALSQNYGGNLAYYGYRMTGIWPYSGEYHTIDFDAYFDSVTSSYDLFLVTNFSDLNAQPELMERLSQLPIYEEGDGYIIYNLHSD